MNICFISQNGHIGKIPRNFPNCRTEFAWQIALNADHLSFDYICKNKVPTYDLAIVILPKKLEIIDTNQVLNICKSIGKKVAVMQEGPNWYWQDYTLDKQIEYFNTLTSADIIYVHNESDRKYYQGLTAHSDVRVMSILMIEDAIGTLEPVERKDVIIGGNFVSWYGGFDSFVFAKELGDTIYAPSMGRKQPGEENLVTHLPYVDWKGWMHQLNRFKYGVHLMRTHAAGTFALNCAIVLILPGVW